MAEKKTGGAFDVFNEFFKNIRELGHMLSSEDLDVAAESLREMQRELKWKRQEQIKKEREAQRLEKERIKKERHDRYVAEVTSMDLPLDWENVFAGDERVAVHTESISDALILSLNNLGKVDIEYISQITGETCKTVIETLRGSIYQNPETWGKCFYKGWETADEYLTGNLKRKWKAAKKATKEFNGYFDANVEAIEKAIPPSVEAIMPYTFEKCKKLEIIFIPPSVISISKSAFYDANPNMIIAGKSGSFAEMYANKHKIKFLSYDNLSIEDVNSAFGIYKSAKK